MVAQGFTGESSAEAEVDTFHFGSRLNYSVICASENWIGHSSAQENTSKEQRSLASPPLPKADNTLGVVAERVTLPL